MDDEMDDKKPLWRRWTVLVPAGVVGVAVLMIALAAFQPWKLVVDEVVDEAPPTVAETNLVVADASVPPPQDSADLESNLERVITARGEFISHEHGTTGEAQLITLADGSRVLRLANLDTSNGPDLKVWLAAAPVIEGEDGWFVFDDEEYLDLGPLKGNKGNQNYPIPADADVSDLTSVTIWCDRFSVSFGAADLVGI